MLFQHPIFLYIYSMEDRNYKNSNPNQGGSFLDSDIVKKEFQKVNSENQKVYEANSGIPINLYGTRGQFSKSDLSTVDPQYLNEMRYNSQSKMDVFGNMVAKMGSSSLVGFAPGFTDIAIGIPQALIQGKFDKIFDNVVTENVYKPFEDYMNENFVSYNNNAQSFKTGVSALFTPKGVEGIGETMGLLAGMVAGAYATAGATAAVKGVGIGAKIAKGASKLGIKNVLKASTKVDDVTELSEAVKMSNKIQSLAQSAKIKTASEKFLHDSIPTIGEAGMEARQLKESIKSNLENSKRFEKNLSEYDSLDIEDELEIETLASDAADLSFIINAVVLTASNYVSLARILNPFKSQSQTLNKIIRNGDKVAGSTYSPFVYSANKTVRALQKGGTLITNYGKDVISEGSQEVIQGATSNTLDNYYTRNNDYDSKNNYSNFTSAFLDSMEESIGRGDLQAEALLGGVMGGTFGAFGARAEKKQKNLNTQAAIEALNRTNLKQSIEYAVRADSLNRDITAAVEKNDKFEIKNLKDDLEFNYVYSHINSEQYNWLKSDVEDLRQLPLEEFKKFAGIEQDVDFTEKDKNRKIDNLLAKVESVKKANDVFDSENLNVHPALKERLVYGMSKAENIDKRQNQLLEELQYSDLYKATKSEFESQLDSQLGYISDNAEPITKDLISKTGGYYSKSQKEPVEGFKKSQDVLQKSYVDLLDQLSGVKEKDISDLKTELENLDSIIKEKSDDVEKKVDEKNNQIKEFRDNNLKTEEEIQNFITSSDFEIENLNKELENILNNERKPKSEKYEELINKRNDFFNNEENSEIAEKIQDFNKLSNYKKSLFDDILSFKKILGYEKITGNAEAFIPAKIGDKSKESEKNNLKQINAPEKQPFSNDLSEEERVIEDNSINLGLTDSISTASLDEKDLNDAKQNSQNTQSLSPTTNSVITAYSNNLEGEKNLTVKEKEERYKNILNKSNEIEKVGDSHYTYRGSSSDYRVSDFSYYYDNNSSNNETQESKDAKQDTIFKLGNVFDDITKTVFESKNELTDVDIEKLVSKNYKSLEELHTSQNLYLEFDPNNNFYKETLFNIVKETIKQKEIIKKQYGIQHFHTGVKVGIFPNENRTFSLPYVAGEIDVLGVDKDYNLIVIDAKTSSSKKDGWQKKHTYQQSMYANILVQNSGLSVRKIAILGQSVLIKNGKRYFENSPITTKKIEISKGVNSLFENKDVVFLDKEFYNQSQNFDPFITYSKSINDTKSVEIAEKRKAQFEKDSKEILQLFFDNPEKAKSLEIFVQKDPELENGFKIIGKIDGKEFYLGFTKNKKSNQRAYFEIEFSVEKFEEDKKHFGESSKIVSKLKGVLNNIDSINNVLETINDQSYKINIANNLLNLSPNFSKTNRVPLSKIFSKQDGGLYKILEGATLKVGSNAFRIDNGNVLQISKKTETLERVNSSLGIVFAKNIITKNISYLPLNGEQVLLTSSDRGNLAEIAGLFEFIKDHNISTYGLNKNDLISEVKRLNKNVIKDYDKTATDVKNLLKTIFIPVKSFDGYSDLRVDFMEGNDKISPSIVVEISSSQKNSESKKIYLNQNSGSLIEFFTGIQSNNQNSYTKTNFFKLLLDNNSKNSESIKGFLEYNINSVNKNDLFAYYPAKIENLERVSTNLDPNNPFYLNVKSSINFEDASVSSVAEETGITLTEETTPSKEQEHSSTDQSNLLFKSEDPNDVPFQLNNDLNNLIDTNWNQVKENLETILPKSVNVDSIKNLVTNLTLTGKEVGAYLNNVIYLGDKIQQGTEYHEAFHYIYRSLLTKEEQSYWSDIASKKFEQNNRITIEGYRNLHPSYKNLSDTQIKALMLEEYMSDEFQNYMNSSRRVSVFSRLFNKILDFIKNILGIAPSIEKLYKSIQNGKFKDYQSNFNTSFENPAFSMLENINYDSETNNKIKNNALTIINNSISEDKPLEYSTDGMIDDYIYANSVGQFIKQSNLKNGFPNKLSEKEIIANKFIPFSVNEIKDIFGVDLENKNNFYYIPCGLIPNYHYDKMIEATKDESRKQNLQALSDSVERNRTMLLKELSPKINDLKVALDFLQPNDYNTPDVNNEDVNIDKENENSSEENDVNEVGEKTYFNKPITEVADSKYTTVIKSILSTIVYKKAGSEEISFIDVDVMDKMLKSILSNSSSIQEMEEKLRNAALLDENGYPYTKFTSDNIQKIRAVYETYRNYSTSEKYDVDKFKNIFYLSYGDLIQTKLVDVSYNIDNYGKIQDTVVYNASDNANSSAYVQKMSKTYQQHFDEDRIKALSNFGLTKKNYEGNFKNLSILQNIKSKVESKNSKEEVELYLFGKEQGKNYSDFTNFNSGILKDLRAFGIVLDVKSVYEIFGEELGHPNLVNNEKKNMFFENGTWIIKSLFQIDGNQIVLDENGQPKFQNSYDTVNFQVIKTKVKKGDNNGIETSSEKTELDNASLTRIKTFASYEQTNHFDSYQITVQNANKKQQNTYVKSNNLMRDFDNIKRIATNGEALNSEMGSYFLDHPFFGTELINGKYYFTGLSKDRISRMSLSVFSGVKEKNEFGETTSSFAQVSAMKKIISDIALFKQGYIPTYLHESGATSTVIKYNDSQDSQISYFNLQLDEVSESFKQEVNRILKKDFDRMERILEEANDNFSEKKLNIHYSVKNGKKIKVSFENPTKGLLYSTINEQLDSNEKRFSSYEIFKYYKENYSEKGISIENFFKEEKIFKLLSSRANQFAKKLITDYKIVTNEFFENRVVKSVNDIIGEVKNDSANFENYVLKSFVFRNSFLELIFGDKSGYVYGTVENQIKRGKNYIASGASLANKNKLGNNISKAVVVEDIVETSSLVPSLGEINSTDAISYASPKARFNELSNTGNANHPMLKDFVDVLQNSDYLKLFHVIQNLNVISQLRNGNIAEENLSYHILKEISSGEYGFSENFVKNLKNENIQNNIKSHSIFKYIYDNRNKDLNNQKFLNKLRDFNLYLNLLNNNILNNNIKSRKIQSYTERSVDNVEKSISKFNSGYLPNRFISQKYSYSAKDMMIKTSYHTLTRELSSTYKLDPTTGNWSWQPKFDDKGSKFLFKLSETFEKDDVDYAMTESAMKSGAEGINLFKDGELPENMTNFEIDLSNMKLQVENPSGKTKVVTGTQLIRLIDSKFFNEDSVNNRLNNGKLTTVSELRNLYQNKLEHLRKITFENVAASMNINIGDYNLFISELESAITSGKNSDLLKYLETKNGYLINDVDSPIIFRKFQEAYVSQFNSSVFSQKSSGLKLTAVSDYGMLNPQTGERLKIHHVSENGSKTEASYAEVLISEEFLSKYGITQEDLIEINSKNGKDLSSNSHLKKKDLARFSDEIMTMLGFRIPTQDHNSMIPFKVVGMLPSFYGSVVVVPREMVALSGMDFDIDSVFALRKEFSIYKKEEILKVIKNDSTISNSIKENIENSEVEKIYSLKQRNLYKTLNSNLYNSNIDNNEITKLLSYVDYIKSNQSDSYKKFKTLNKLNNFNVSVFDYLKSIGKPSNFEEYSNNFDSIYTKEELANDMLDIKLSFFNLGNKEKFDQLFLKKTDVTNIKDISKEIFVSDGTNTLTYSSPAFQTKQFLNITSGGKSIGIAAQGSVTYAELAKLNVKLADTYFDSLVNSQLGIEIRDRFSFDEIKVGNKTYSISELHSETISVSVDNVKEVLLRKVNMTENTMPVWQTMISLGVDPKLAIATLVSPFMINAEKTSHKYGNSIQNTYNYRNREIKETFESFLEKEESKENLLHHIDLNLDFENKIKLDHLIRSKEIIENLKSKVGYYPMTIDFLENLFSETEDFNEDFEQEETYNYMGLKNLSFESAQYISDNIGAIKAAYTLELLHSRTVETLLTISNDYLYKISRMLSTNKAVSVGFYENIETIKMFEDYGFLELWDEYIKNPDYYDNNNLKFEKNLVFHNIGSQLIGNKNLVRNYINLKKMINLTKHYTMFTSPKFLNAISALNLKKEDQISAFNNLSTFFTQISLQRGANSPSGTKIVEMLNDQIKNNFPLLYGDNTILDELKAILKNKNLVRKYENNEFLKLLVPEIKEFSYESEIASNLDLENSKLLLKNLKINSRSKYNSEQRSNIKNGFLQLFTSNDPEISKFARNLILHQILTNGYSYKNGAFTQFIPDVISKIILKSESTKIRNSYLENSNVDLSISNSDSFENHISKSFDEKFKMNLSQFLNGFSYLEGYRILSGKRKRNEITEVFGKIIPSSEKSIASKMDAFASDKSAKILKIDVFSILNELDEISKNRYFLNLNRESYSVEIKDKVQPLEKYSENENFENYSPEEIEQKWREYANSRKNNKLLAQSVFDFQSGSFITPPFVNYNKNLYKLIPGEIIGNYGYRTIIIEKFDENDSVKNNTISPFIFQSYTDLINSVKNVPESVIDSGEGSQKLRFGQFRQTVSDFVNVLNKLDLTTEKGYSASPKESVFNVVDKKTGADFKIRSFSNLTKLATSQNFQSVWEGAFGIANIIEFIPNENNQSDLINEIKSDKYFYLNSVFKTENAELYKIIDINLNGNNITLSKVEDETINKYVRENLEKLIGKENNQFEEHYITSKTTNSKKESPKEDLKSKIIITNANPEASVVSLGNPNVNKSVVKTESEKNIENKQKESVSSNFISLKQAEYILQKLSKTFGIPYEIGVFDGDWKGMYANGKVYINTKSGITMETLFHEYGHPFIEAIKVNDPKLYAELVEEISQDSELMDRTDALYPELSFEDRITEAIVQKLGELTEEKKTTSFVTKILKAIRDILVKTFGISKVESESINQYTKISELATILGSDTTIYTNSFTIGKTASKNMDELLEKLVSEGKINYTCKN